MKQALTGKFVVLDGPDGCGKSTQVRLLSGCRVGVELKIDNREILEAILKLPKVVI